ncbi:MAG: GNAT family N-acetyltransferase [Caldilineaceae bacterium]|nr:GNAT family N-acetyltransferase [Caldilineaceae bacterium]
MTVAAQGPAYRIETARTVLRCWQPADAPLLAAAIAASVEHLRPWMPWVAAEPMEFAQRVKLMRRFRAGFDRDDDYVYGIFTPDESAVLGGTGLHTRLGNDALEIGYWIHADHVRQGLAGEIAAALTKVAFAVHGVHRVEIHCDPLNTASASVPRKLGFVHEATRRQDEHRPDGSYRDTMIWTMLEDEFASSPAAQADIRAYDVLGAPLL